jgi:ATP-dependent Clp protease ATP-binding subunit ClpA
LDEELGLPPGEETATLYEAIKAKRMLGSYLKFEQSRRAKEPIQQDIQILIDQEADRGALQESYVVGRETELKELHPFLTRALDGDRQLVFVTGETGVGKTTLVEVFLEQVTIA